MKLVKMLHVLLWSVMAVPCVSWFVGFRTLRAWGSSASLGDASNLSASGLVGINGNHAPRQLRVHIDAPKVPSTINRNGSNAKLLDAKLAPASGQNVSQEAMSERLAPFWRKMRKEISAKKGSLSRKIVIKKLERAQDDVVSQEKAEASSVFSSDAKMPVENQRRRAVDQNHTSVVDQNQSLVVDQNHTLTKVVASISSRNSTYNRGDVNASAHGQKKKEVAGAPVEDIRAVATPVSLGNASKTVRNRTETQLKVAVLKQPAKVSVDNATFAMENDNAHLKAAAPLRIGGTHAVQKTAEATDVAEGQKQSALGCVCGGIFGEGDRVLYLGKSFPVGRVMGTVLGGTDNGYLNIDWDGLTMGHDGNCQYASCGQCTRSSTHSRWFTPCSDVRVERSEG